MMACVVDDLPSKSISDPDFRTRMDFDGMMARVVDDLPSKSISDPDCRTPIFVPACC
jgi:hypothetical protein